MFEFFILALILLVCFWTYKIIVWTINKFRKFPIDNSYINIHKKKISDDERYTQYLEWCKKNGQVAMDKKGFEEIRDNEKALYEKYHRIGIS